MDVAMLGPDERMMVEWIIRALVVGLTLGFCWIASTIWNN